MDEERKKVVETRTCKEADCGNTFPITQGEKDFYQSKGMPLPLRCQKCRIKRASSIKNTMQIPLK